MRRVVQVLTLSAAVAAAGAALAQAPKSGAPPAPAGPGNPQATHGSELTPDMLKWGPAPASLPPGAQAAVLEGDPTQKGMFTVRLRMPDKYRIPPHSHSSLERITVLSGTFNVGMGTRADASSVKPLPPGSFFTLQPGGTHFAEMRGETIVQISGEGPFDIKYVNPADDPQRAKASPGGSAPAKP